MACGAWRACVSADVHDQTLTWTSDSSLAELRFACSSFFRILVSSAHELHGRGRGILSLLRLDDLFADVPIIGRNSIPVSLQVRLESLFSVTRPLLESIRRMHIFTVILRCHSAY